VGGGNAAILNVRHILEQLDWFRDELLAQEPFLVRIPDVQLTASPLPDVPSLLERYQSLLEREASLVGFLKGTVEPVTGTDIAAMVRGIADRRSRMLTLLPEPEDGAWQEAGLAQWAFDVTLGDGDALRQVAERLHESSLYLSRPGRVHGA
jgi:hypothetical protein